GGTHLLGHDVADGLPVVQDECGAVDQPGDPVRALIGDLADRHSAKAVPGEDHRAGAVGIKGGKHSRHIVVVADPGAVFADVAAPGRGGGDDAVAAGAQGVPPPVPAPGALPGPVDQDECLCVSHVLQPAGAAPPRSSRQPVNLVPARVAAAGSYDMVAAFMSLL